MMTRLASLVLVAGLLAAPPAAADFEQIELFQRQEVMAQQQRLVGNLRALARRDGIVVNVPQLFVYHTDLSEAYHRDGFRAGFERELELTVDRRRGARSMIRLDRLLGRVTTADGAEFTIEDLPEADVFLALYRRLDCEECEQVAASLRAWIAANPGRRVMWLDVRTDSPRG